MQGLPVGVAAVEVGEPGVEVAIHELTGRHAGSTVRRAIDDRRSHQRYMQAGEEPGGLGALVRILRVTP